jgi:DNA-binding helix-hairpin-helix protein with protein kinase domain
MNPKITLTNGVVIQIEKTPFASGGEADVYAIISPTTYSQQVLKIYKPDKRTRSKEEKLNFLISNKPNLSSNNGHHSVIWPIHVAHQNGSFLGYTMPRATGIKLELLCHPKLPKTLSKDWEKFSFNSPGSIELRLKLCFNIAVALAQVHSFGSYVLVDMKPDNVMIKSDGLISIIDIDSTEIISANRVLYPAQVATPEYTPPEYYSHLTNIEKNLIPETWDRFSLSIIFYRLLFGIHPYTASLKPPYESLTNVSELIQKGFFPCGRHQDKFKIVPPPHRNFFRVSKQIQHLFLTTFDDSFSNVAIRPSADDWCKVLSPEPVIQINRHIPSKLPGLFKRREVNSSEIKKIPTLKLTKPGYLAPEKPGSFFTRLKNLISKSEKQKLFDEIANIQSRIDSQYSSIEKLYQDILKFQKGLNEKQRKAKKKSNTSIDQLIDKYHKMALSTDKLAEKYIEQERNKKMDYQKVFLKEYNLTEIKIKEAHNSIVKSFELQVNSEKENLTVQLSSLNQRETTQIQLLDTQLKNSLEDIKKQIQIHEKEFTTRLEGQYKLKLSELQKRKDDLKKREIRLLAEALEKYQSGFSNNQLNQYKIYDDRFSIFTDSYADPDRIVANLNRSGIVTAADIKGVDESGRILKANGSWIKVSEVAVTRAKKLEAWRKRMERQSPAASPPQTLPYSEELKVKQALAADLQKIEEDEKKLSKEIMAQKNTPNSELAKILAQAKANELKVTNDIQQKKQLVSKEISGLRNEITKKINDISANTGKLIKVQNEKFETATKNEREKMKELVVRKDSEFEKITQEFDPIHLKLEKDIRGINSNFESELNIIISSLIAEFKSIESENEKRIIEYSKTANEMALIYNQLVNNLVLEQSKYKQY